MGEKTREAALLSLQRLISLLEDPDTSNADVLKASALIFERIYPLQTADPASQGDFVICVDEGPAPAPQENTTQQPPHPSMDAQDAQPCEPPQPHPPTSALGPQGRESGTQQTSLRSVDAPSARTCDQTTGGISHAAYHASR